MREPLTESAWRCPMTDQPTTLADLIYEPNEYAEAVEWYRLTRLDPKRHLNDELADKLLAIAGFGVQELREALDLADELGQHWREQEIVAGRDPDAEAVSDD